MYSDDLGMASAGYNDLIIYISNDLASLLGMIFKWRKDVESAKILELIGYEIYLSPSGIWIRARPKLIAKLLTLLATLTTDSPITFASVEQLLGLISHAALVCKYLPTLQSPLFNHLRPVF